MLENDGREVRRLLERSKEVRKGASMGKVEAGKFGLEYEGKEVSRLLERSKLERPCQIDEGKLELVTF